MILLTRHQQHILLNQFRDVSGYQPTNFLQELVRRAITCNMDALLQTPFDDHDAPHCAPHQHIYRMGCLNL